MPLWTIEGADKTTGNDVVRSIDAPTQDLARQTAVEMGILVADIHRSAADPLEELGAAVQASQADKNPGSGEAAVALDYSTVRKNPSAPLIPTAAVVPPPLEYPTTPEYQDIIVGAKWLRGVAIAVAIIGWISIAIAVLGFLIAIAGMVFGATIGPLEVGLPFVMTIAGFGVAYLAGAAVLRLAASVAMAVRDIARNSFKH